MLEEERPPYDPRMAVNIEASKLYWGSEADRKEYNKKLRRYVILKHTISFTILTHLFRAVQRSSEDL